MKCYYCNESADVRPYGPKGSMICFKCATSTPAMEEECKNNFIAQLEACGPVAIIDGTEVGVYIIGRQ